MLDLVEMDWLQHDGEGLLHHAALNSTQQHDMEWESRCADVTLTCGAMVEAAWIPGPSSRMGDMRCNKCCDVVGIPRGKGSPKNDPACRIILGLD